MTEHFMLGGGAFAEKSEYFKGIEATATGLQFAPDDEKAYFNIGKFHYHLESSRKL